MPHPYIYTGNRQTDTDNYKTHTHTPHTTTHTHTHRVILVNTQNNFFKSSVKINLIGWFQLANSVLCVSVSFSLVNLFLENPKTKILILFKHSSSFLRNFPMSKKHKCISGYVGVAGGVILAKSANSISDIKGNASQVIAL